MNYTHRRPASLIFFLTIFLSTCVACLAQSTAARPDRGVTAAGSYNISDLEVINTTNGNLRLSIPLAQLPPIAGGKLSGFISATYDSKVWDGRTEERRQTWNEPIYQARVPQLADNGGWKIGGMYNITGHLSTSDYDAIPVDGDPDFSVSWSKLILTTPDGGTHELRPLDYAPYSGNHEFLYGFYGPINSGGAPIRYYSFDGSFLWAKLYPNPTTTAWELYLADGTKVVQLTSGIQRITDTNGNSIKIFSDIVNGLTTTHYQDEQTAREIKITYDPSGNNNQGSAQVLYQTVGGGWSAIDINFGRTTVSGKIYRIQGPYCDINEPLWAELSVIREIILPQTEPGVPRRKFVFAYNSDVQDSTSIYYQPYYNCNGLELLANSMSHGMGSLSQMSMPSGAVVNYTYNHDGSSGADFDGDGYAEESISGKSITHDGIVESWTYNITNSTGSVAAPDGSVTTDTAYFHSPGYSTFIGGSNGLAGLVYRTNYSNKVLVERHWVRLKFSGAYENGPGSLLVFNPVVDAEYTSLLDESPSHNPIKMAAKTYQYDYNGNVLSETVYDWFDPGLVSRDVNGVPTGVPAGATVLRVLSRGYYNPATSASSANVYAKRSVATVTPLILNALQQATVGPLITQFSYDGLAYGSAPTIGNLTTKKVWDDLDNKWITTTHAYGAYGNLVSSTDGRGKTTQFFYDDATHATPTRIVGDPQNGTGTQTVTTAYDFATGVVTSQTDANGQQWVVNYTNQLLAAVDPLNRPGFIESPTINIGGANHKRRVTTTYLDSVRQVMIETDLNAANDKLLKTRTTSDMLGRTVLTEQTEDGPSYTVSVVSKYLDMGRVTLTSSAKRSTPAATDNWTRVTRDNAGRVIEVANFGGATQPAWSGTAGVFNGAVTSTYDANFTTVTDQAGKVRRSMIDAMGRLRRVDEPDAANNLGSTAAPVQPTTYAYDVFNNLTTVTQGSQVRTFTYDSLSRLRTEVNPESGTATYQYDDNGNLVVKTDARGVSEHLEYDSLNRPTRRWYNASNLVTATTHNTPALPSPVGATPEARMFYDSQALPAGAPSYSRGSATGRLVAQTYNGGNTGNYFAYDVLGRTTLKIQRTGTVNYQLAATYNLSGANTLLTYPSGHTVASTYDQAGRLTSLGGTLGDGTTRAYATGLVYSPDGDLLKEQFGTSTPVYNKLFYNSRGQLAEIRTSTSYTGPSDTTWDRGAIINSYSTLCTGICSGLSMSDNNGNLRKQEIYIPGQQMRWQQYDYDSLNRLNFAREVLDGGTEQWKQQFTYDRWGNRTINTSVTYGTGINNKAFTVNTANNRLGVPGGQSGSMSYDAAGNLTTDTYTGAGNRIYDANNKITSAWGGNNQAQNYTYDAAGQRIKRSVDGVEMWYVYGFGGELVAEYPAAADPSRPLKEYGYRNGQLLVAADGRVNVALAANGGVASASSAHTCCGFSVGGAINGNVRGPWGNGEGWNDATDNVVPDWFQVDFNGSKTINEIDVFSLHDNYTEQNSPTETQLFTLYGLINFQVQYWNGSAWTTIPGGNVTGNNKVWRKFAFAPITTSKIRLWITGVPDAWTRLVELQAWEAGAGVTNLALNKPASQSSTDWGGVAQRGADGNTDGNYWNNSVTHTATQTQPWWQVDLQSVTTIENINVWNRTDCCGEALSNFYVFVSDNPFTATDVASTQNQAGVSTYYVAGQGGVPSTVGVNRTGRYVRVQLGGVERLSVAEVEVFGGSALKQVRWLVTDQLGTPRMTLDQSGSLAGVKRHDYLPFGEELFAPAGGRTAQQGYGAGDGVRQQFTQKERDVETNLDYFQARYYSSTQGRFVSADSFLGSPGNPQTLNLYSYVTNNPLRFIDPSGHMPVERRWGKCGPGCQDPPKDNQDPKDPEVIRTPFVPVSDPTANPAGDILDGPIVVKDPGGPIPQTEPVLATLPPSKLDYLPAVGPARQFLFNYTTHNFEGALGSFVLLAIDLSPLGHISRGAKLTTLGLENAPRGVAVSKAGLAIVEKHLAQFGEDAANTMMMERIRAAHQYGLRIFGPYKDFYMHELYESTMMSKGIPWAESHLASLERYGATQMQLYHPKIIQHLHKTKGMFSQAYLDFWGIK